MKEIEVKAKVSDLEVLAKKLEGIGCVISKPVEQDDTVFINYEGSFVDFKSGGIFVRIRRMKDKSFLTVKQPQDNELDAIEYETEISNPDDTHKALVLMGYREMVRVHKIRRTTKCRGYEVCLDDVTDLGSFIEVEKITDESSNGEEVQNELFDFLINLGVKREDRIVNGYDTLMYLKKHQ